MKEKNEFRPNNMTTAYVATAKTSWKEKWSEKERKLVCQKQSKKHTKTNLKKKKMAQKNTTDRYFFTSSFTVYASFVISSDNGE